MGGENALLLTEAQGVGLNLWILRDTNIQSITEGEESLSTLQRSPGPLLDLSME